MNNKLFTFVSLLFAGLSIIILFLLPNLYSLYHVDFFIGFKVGNFFVFSPFFLALIGLFFSFFSSKQAVFSMLMLNISLMLVSSVPYVMALSFNSP
ncbi:putative ATPase [Bacillus sp. TS-2]|nr:putative ATPase [Bacillus sp. TS-2]